MKRSARNVFLAMFGASFVGGLLATSAVAQTINLGAANSADFKVVYATAQDVAEGKQVADTMCARCHGINGISKEKGVPHIAGQRAVYLLLEMKVYQAGGRGSKLMANTVKYMNDDAIMKVAAYYASLESAEPTSGGSAKAAPAKPSAVSAGKAAAAGCGGLSNQHVLLRCRWIVGKPVHSVEVGVGDSRCARNADTKHQLSLLRRRAIRSVG